MPITVICPGCGTRVAAPDGAKAVTCPSCRTVVPVVPVVAVAARPVAARPVRRDEDEDDVRSRRRSARPAEDDDVDDRPRRKRQTKGVPVWMFAAGGVALLFVVGVAAVGGWLLLGKGPAAGGGGGLVGGGLIRKAPPGWTDVRDGEGGYQVYLPGQIHKSKHTVSGPRAASGVQVSAHGGSDGSATVMARSIKQPANFTPGTTPELLFAQLKQEQPGFEAPWNEIESKTPVTLDGKPGLLVKVKEKKDWMGAGKDIGFQVPKGLPEDLRKQWEEDMQRHKQTREDLKKKRAEREAARPGWREVFLITVSDQRVIVIQWRGTGEYLDDAALKTIIESFEFL